MYSLESNNNFGGDDLEEADKTTTAKLKRSTLIRLKSLLGEKMVKKKETVEDCINRLLDFYEQANPNNPMPAEVSG